jgi:hypothetical protein
MKCTGKTFQNVTANLVRYFRPQYSDRNSHAGEYYSHPNGYADHYPRSCFGFMCIPVFGTQIKMGSVYNPAMLDHFFEIRTRTLHFYGLPETLKTLKNSLFNDDIFPDFRTINLALQEWCLSGICQKIYGKRDD